jgi:hypothetical protein
MHQNLLNFWNNLNPEATARNLRPLEPIEPLELLEPLNDLNDQETKFHLQLTTYKFSTLFPHAPEPESYLQQATSNTMQSVGALGIQHSALSTKH